MVSLLLIFFFHFKLFFSLCKYRSEKLSERTVGWWFKRKKQKKKEKERKNWAHRGGEGKKKGRQGKNSKFDVLFKKNWLKSRTSFSPSKWFGPALISDILESKCCWVNKGITDIALWISKGLKTDFQRVSLETGEPFSASAHLNHDLNHSKTRLLFTTPRYSSLFLTNLH